MLCQHCANAHLQASSRGWSYEDLANLQAGMQGPTRQSTCLQAMHGTNHSFNQTHEHEAWLACCALVICKALKLWLSYNHMLRSFAVVSSGAATHKVLWQGCRFEGPTSPSRPESICAAPHTGSSCNIRLKVTALNRLKLGVLRPVTALVLLRMSCGVFCTALAI